jgi:hypothetical protein
MRLGVIILGLLLFISATAWADGAPGPCFILYPHQHPPRPRPGPQPSSRPTTQRADASMPLSFAAGGLLASSALIGGGLLLSRRRRGD